MFEYKQITNSEAIKFILPRHYSGRKPNAQHSFGVFKNGELKACVTFGVPASNHLCRGICGEQHKKQVLELNRLCRTDDFSEPLSKLIGFALRELGKIGNFVIIAYSDTAMHHIGYIYQATNFLYLGKTKSRTDKCYGNGRHARHATSANEVYRVIRSSKHRYVTFIGRRKFKKEALKNLKYKISPYPKGESRKYKLGTFLKDEIVGLPYL